MIRYVGQLLLLVFAALLIKVPPVPLHQHSVYDGLVESSQLVFVLGMYGGEGGSEAVRFVCVEYIILA